MGLTITAKCSSENTTGPHLSSGPWDGVATAGREGVTGSGQASVTERGFLEQGGGGLASVL